MKEIHDEQAELSNVPGGDDTKNQVLVQDLERVKQMIQSLTELYHELMKLCQQKRDLFIVAVKFHMAVRQVISCNYFFRHHYIKLFLYSILLSHQHKVSINTLLNFVNAYSTTDNDTCYVYLIV